MCRPFAFRTAVRASEKKRPPWPKSSGCHRRRLRPNRPAIAMPGIAKKLVWQSAWHRVIAAMAGLDLPRLRLRAWTAKKVCRRCRDVVRCGSIGWAAVVQRRTVGRRTQSTNHGMDRSGGKPLSNGPSVRRRSVIPIVRRIEKGMIPRQ
jgi:hypothetical protein